MTRPPPRRQAELVLVRKDGAGPNGCDDAVAEPAWTVVVPAYGQPALLHRCLSSLAEQRGAPTFELLVIDDGSVPPLQEIFPPSTWPCRGRLIQQELLGVAAARNRGIREARGRIVVWVDTDVTLEPGALGELWRAIETHPADAVFQIRLVGGSATLVHRMENLRLQAIQRASLGADGHTGYLNTSAGALRKSTAVESEVFPVSLPGGEDTGLLVRLEATAQRPRYVSAAVASHRPPLSLPRFLWKHLWIGFRSAAARRVLRATGGTMRPAQRWRMGLEIWRLARGSPRDLLAAALIVPAFALECLGRLAARLRAWPAGPLRIFSLRVDAVSDAGIIVRVAEAARTHRGLTLTYLTAWTLAQANRAPAMNGLLRSFDVCYADGMGVGVTMRLLSGGYVRKVTANHFFVSLCRELTLQGRTVALIGTEPAAIRRARRAIAAAVPGIRIVFTSHGFLTDEQSLRIRQALSRLRPDVVFVGMGQPRQEEWVTRHREALPGAVYFCVGGLFDYFAGTKPTPPALVRQLGFEWLYLLLSCPRKFGYRYVVGLPQLALDIVRYHAGRVRSAFATRRRRGGIAGLAVNRSPNG